MPAWRNVFFLGWAGIRGGDSLVIALSLPLVTGSGAPFPGRTSIIFITFLVIVVTLVFLGLSLAPLVRRLGLEDDGESTRARRRGAQSASSPRREDALERSTRAAVTVRADGAESSRRRGGSSSACATSGRSADDVLLRLQHELDLQEVLLESRPTAPPSVRPHDVGPSA